jgi:hypothetical protein
MNKHLLTLLFCFVIAFSLASEHDFTAKAIPAALKGNSNAVVRFRDVILEIKSARKAVYSVHHAVTILKNEAADNAILLVHYDEFSKIRKLRGIVYDENGKKVEQIEWDHFFDISAISGSSTFEDGRVIASIPKYRTVPFTIEYNYEIDYSGILDYPDFYLLNDFNTAMEQATLTVYVPDSIGFRYFLKNTEVKPDVQKQKSTEVWSWNFSNVMPVREEPFCPSIQEISPAVMLAPLSFRLDKRWGSGDTWKSYGAWCYDLIKGRDGLGEESIRKIGEMVAGITDTLEKIRTLYGYMQNRTRYTSVQIGIGNWQPAPATEVDRVGYGDCKALTNYMKAILKAAGIESVYTLVRSGVDSPDLIADFPASQFNHVILCVPLKKDTVWLECTSQVTPAGYLGSFTDNRYVLMVRESGGYLGRTPVYDQSVNFLNTASRVKLQEDGSAIMEVVRSYNGLFYDKTYKLLQLDETDKKIRIAESISASNFVLLGFALREYRSSLPRIDETLNLSIRKMGVQAGGMMLLLPNQLTREEDLASQVINRNNPVEIKRSTLKTDTVYIQLPDGFAISGNNLSQSVSSKFGEYRSATSSDGNTIRYVRSLLVYKGVYTRELYEDFLGFFEKVSVADNKKISVKRLVN